MSLTVQLQTMLIMVAMGGWLGMAIDTYSRLIRGRNWKKWITVINDSLFWVLQGLLVFYILLQVNEGEMRFYILLALLCGYSCYRALLFSIYLKILEALISTIIKTYKFCKAALFMLIINPTKELLKLLYKLCMMVISFTISVIFFLLEVIYTPFVWIGKGIWRLLPKEKIKKYKSKLGFLSKIKNYIKQRLNKKE
ncbi:spore cortex biosynthesis protein YabQ [Anaerobacillus alkalidiazotrophicus]|uniref:Spore cortex biosynthesis protein YabQ n=1 Tax=Anaerobacillus alkalidiazotrophicus TaxID=472963 RepID=A0A1S2M7Q4_9BACI|nr:spore cortex biosynthesis protein YabQ [Anaerobacillus alkalidiazotrophicus]OIJ20513.1 spore cortex biosynthesis protein YabQ [Anaerobacillus alkalidiazotrophicus]